ncbi:MAG: hypothetical protein IH944_06075 [Armatimonadetes bacterium]|nr:hypothetical protein [Armatimonadota bacterium]
MLAFYIIAGVVGGGLILISALGAMGGGDVDVGHDIDFDASHDIDFDHDLSATVGADHEFDPGFEVSSDYIASDFHLSDVWLAFLSLRFWTYFIGTFGILGVVMTWLKVASAPTILATSLITGFLMGYGVSMAIRFLRKSQIHSGVTSQDFLGTQGKMIVGTRGAQPGKVRLRIKDDIIDMLALSEKGADIERGEVVVVIGLEGERVCIARKTDVLG